MPVTCPAIQSSRCVSDSGSKSAACARSEEHTSELQSRLHLVCRLLLEKKNSLPTRRCSDLSGRAPPCNPVTATSRMAAAHWKEAKPRPERQRVSPALSTDRERAQTSDR